RADPAEHLGAGPVELGHAHSDRLRVLPGEPAIAPRRIRQDQRERAGQERPHDRGRTAPELREGLEQELDVPEQQRDRLALVATLEPSDRPRRGLSIRIRAEPVDGVRREHDRLPRPDRLDSLVDHAAAGAPRKESAASRKASGASTKLKCPHCGMTTSSTSAMPSSRSAALAGPVMKSSAPVTTSVGAVLSSSVGRRSNVSKISWLNKRRASAFGLSARKVSRYARSLSP